MEPVGNDRFTVWAEVASHPKPLLMLNLTFARLFDDIVVPYQTGEMFFIDGMPVKPTDLNRIKILQVKHGLEEALAQFNYTLTYGETQRSKVMGDQYHTRLEAILRQHTEDVTAQIIKAYDRAIKPKIKDYLPKRDELINAAVKVFVEAVKALV